jgi:hypothetical protein
MKTKALYLAMLFLLILKPGFSQEKSKKELKEEKKIETQKQVEAMINAKEFRFVGRTALPTGMRSVNLSSNPNYMKFQPEMIESEMPFFGKAYSAVGYGNDTGVKFKGKPEKFEVVKKSKAFEIEAEVKGSGDNFRISLSVGFEGSASLSITSNKRSTITYQGDIFPLEEKQK